ncbi:MAG: DUF4129 domain-containing protein [Deltaproteobacteria bacterium]|nr:DUF4129 domain-containing protein [Deltaproteobacteria bacterium]
MCYLCIEASWIAAWIAFIGYYTLQREIPIVGIFLILLVATTAARFEKLWRRRIAAILIQGCGLAVLSVLAVRLFLFSGDSSIDGGHENSFRENLKIIEIVLAVIVVWIRGIVLSGRDSGRDAVASSFDMGLLAFFSLFLIKLGLTARHGLLLADSAGLPHFVTFLFAAILSYGLSAQKSPSGFVSSTFCKSVLYLFAFGCAVCAIAGVAAFVLMPLLSSGADVVLAGIQDVAGPIGMAVARVLAFLVTGVGRFPATIPAQSPSATQKFPSANLAHHDSGFLETAVFWIFLAVAFIGLALALVILLWQLFRWLISERTGCGNEQAGLLHFYVVFYKIRNLIRHCIGWMRSEKAMEDGPRAGFRFLLHWGKIRGVSRNHSETPAEYGRRLAAHCSDAVNSIGAIIEAYNGFTYGGLIADDKETTSLHKAVSRLEKSSGKLLPGLTDYQGRLRITSYFNPSGLEPIE